MNHDAERIAAHYTTADGAIDVAGLEADRAKLERQKALDAEIQRLAEAAAQHPTIANTAAVLERVSMLAQFKDIAGGELRQDLADTALHAISGTWGVVASEMKQPWLDVGSVNIACLATQQCDDLPWLFADVKAILKYISHGDFAAVWRVCRHRLACDELVELQST